MRLAFSLISVFFLLIICSCNQKQAEVYYDLSLEEVTDLAKLKNKPFCLALLSKECPTCEKYLEILNGRMKDLTSSAIFNVVDVTIPENKWLQQWICSMGTPITCVFSSLGQLEAIVSGTSELSFNCLGNVLDGDVTCSKFLYKSPLTKFKQPSVVIDALNKTLMWKYKIEGGENIDEEMMNRELRILHYPFNLFLRLNYEQKMENSEATEIIANELLSFQDDYYTRLYFDLFFDVKKVIDPEFSIENAAKLEIENNKIVLENCKLDKSTPFVIKLRNMGKATLKIFQVQKSCSCISFKGNETYDIEPNETLSLDFSFIPDSRGEIFREVYFISNAVNYMERIEVAANVK